MGGWRVMFGSTRISNRWYFFGKLWKLGFLFLRKKMGEERFRKFQRIANHWNIWILIEFFENIYLIALWKLWISISMNYYTYVYSKRVKKGTIIINIHDRRKLLISWNRVEFSEIELSRWNWEKFLLTVMLNDVSDYYLQFEMLVTEQLSIERGDGITFYTERV